MILRSTYLHAVIGLMLILMLIAASPRTQPDSEIEDTDSLVSLRIIVEIDSIPESLLAPFLDSTIVISLYKGQIINARPYVQNVCTLGYHESHTSKVISFDSIPLASYTMAFYFGKYDYRRKETRDLSEETEYVFNLTPPFYSTTIYANPVKYRAHCTYRDIERIKDEKYYFGDSDPADGVIEISLLEKKICRLVLETCDPDTDFTEVFDFSSNSFRGRYERGIPFSDESARPFMEVIITRIDR